MDCCHYLPSSLIAFDNHHSGQLVLHQRLEHIRTIFFQLVTCLNSADLLSRAFSIYMQFWLRCIVYTFVRSFTCTHLMKYNDTSWYIYIDVCLFIFLFIYTFLYSYAYIYICTGIHNIVALAHYTSRCDQGVLPWSSCCGCPWDPVIQPPFRGYSPSLELGMVTSCHQQTIKVPWFVPLTNDVNALLTMDINGFRHLWYFISLEFPINEVVGALTWPLVAPRDNLWRSTSNMAGGWSMMVQWWSTDVDWMMVG